jgi:hypothetical protein
MDLEVLFLWFVYDRTGDVLRQAARRSEEPAVRSLDKRSTIK